MNVLIVGAGAMGAALSVPLTDNGVEVTICGTEFDVGILKLLERGEKHPRIGRELEKVRIAYPDELLKEVDKHDVILLAVSTDGVTGIFDRISDLLDHKNVITISKGLLEIGGRILTVPEFMWDKNPYVKVVAITGPSIAREVAARNPTRVVFSSDKIELAEKAAKLFETDYYRINPSEDIIGAEITSALKNVYSIGIAWVRGYEVRMGGIEMSNLKGVLVTMAIDETARVVVAAGGKKETVYSLSGFGDLIATFRGGRNGMLGELLGKGMGIEQALTELRKRGVGVVEGYGTARKAYRLLKEFEMGGKLKADNFPFMRGIVDVLYRGMDVEDVLFEII